MNDSRKSLDCLENLTKRQIDCLNDAHRFIVLPAGRRSRKTLICKRKVFYPAMENPGYRYFHGAPTRQQAKQIFWDDLKKYTRPYWMNRPNETELYVKLLNNSEIHVIGLDRPERIEGQPWNGCHITEIGNVRESAWTENIRPVLSDTKGFALLDGVPEGRNHYYDIALYATGGALPKTKPIEGAFKENPEDKEWCYYSWFSSDVLDAEEIESNRRIMDPKTFRQEYEGSFESYKGLAYYTFGDHNFADVQRDWQSPISVGMDFNVNPMTATLGTIRKKIYYQWGEIFMEDSNTFEMVDTLLEYVDHPNEIHIYPDSTGEHDGSNATRSDIAMLKKAGFIIHAKTKNPFIKDRVNSVNSVLKDMGKQTRYFINPKTCPKTINDFNKVTRQPDGRINKDKSDKESQLLTHISDALGYLITFNWPVTQSSMSYTERY